MSTEISSPPAAAPSRSATVRVLSTLLPGMLVLYGLYQGIQQVLVPAQLQAIDPTAKVANLALVALVSSVAGTIALPLGGALSDRTHGRFGRRGPWLFVSSVLCALVCVVLAQATSVPTMVIGIGFLWFFANIYQGVIYAVIPDRIPESLRGVASSVVGLGLPLGVLIFVNLVTITGQFWGYLSIGAFLVIATVALVVIAPEGRVERPVRVPRTTKPSFIKMTRSFLSGFSSRDFTMVFLSRVAFFAGIFAASSYVFYVITDYIGVENTPSGQAETSVATIATTNTISQIIAIVIMGWVADRTNRRKLIVALASLGMAVAFIVPFVLPTWTGMLIYAGVGGAAAGVYVAIDIAIMTLVLPNKGFEGRDLALLALATSVPAAFAPAIGAAFYEATGGFTTTFVFASVMAVLGAVFMFMVRKVR
ncbi:MFS transporter [Micrococcaceae bacterium Sec5.1]